jgi:hypothetical protein
MEVWLLTIALLSSRPGFVTPPWMQRQYEFSTREDCWDAIRSGQFKVAEQNATDHSTALAVYCTRKDAEVTTKR